MNPEKLAKLQSQVRIGGKGTPRRKVKKAQKAPQQDDKKLQETLKKLNVQSLPQVEEVNMFYQNGQILHFSRPQVQASVASNTFVVNGLGLVKDLTQLLPGILTQLGPESLAELKKLAEQFQKQQQAGAAPATGDDDDDVPDLVDGDNFDDVPELVDAQ